MDSIKEVLKKVLSDDFIKECAEDFTKDGIEQLTGTMLGAVTKTFFEKWNYCRALTQAEKEGTGANQKQLKEFIENWKSDSSVYSEDELNDMFERTYQELQKNSENFKEVDKEELCKQYKKFVTEYMKSLMSEVTTGEKIVIQKVDGIRENIKEVSDNTQEANRILQDMNKNADVPIIDFVKNIVKVEHYDYKYTGLYNTFDYVEDTYEEDADSCYVFSFDVNNIGKCLVKSIKISNLKVYYKKPDDSEPLRYARLYMVADEKTEKECVVNMLPNSQEKIRFAVQMEEDEDDFMEDAIHNEMCIAFNMKLLGEDNNCSEKLMIINIINDLKEFPVGEYSIDSINS